MAEEVSWWSADDDNLLGIILHDAEDAKRDVPLYTSDG
jgi:hypothetical protein